MSSSDDRHRIDLAPIATCSFSDVFGEKTYKFRDADQTFWTFLMTRGLVTEIPLENPGDHLRWLIPVEIPELTPEEEKRMERQMNPLSKEFLTFDDLADRRTLQFTSVGAVTLGEIFGTVETTDREMWKRWLVFVKESGVVTGMLSDEDLIRMRSLRIDLCAYCQASLRRNYCRQCDEFFDEGHANGCTLAAEPGPDGDNHWGHRTY